MLKLINGGSDDKMDLENKEQVQENKSKNKKLTIFVNILLIMASILLLLRISLLVFFTSIYVTGPSMFLNRQRLS